MGQQGAHVCDVILDECRITKDKMIGGSEKLNKGFQTAMKTLDRGRLHISALSVGCAKRLIELSVSYSKDRKQFGKRSPNSNSFRECSPIARQNAMRLSPWYWMPLLAGRG